MGLAVKAIHLGPTCRTGMGSRRRSFRQPKPEKTRTIHNMRGRWIPTPCFESESHATEIRRAPRGTRTGRIRSGYQMDAPTGRRHTESGARAGGFD